MPEDYFGEEIAQRHDETSADMFDPAVVEPAVAFLADLAGSGAALELGIARSHASRTPPLIWSPAVPS